MTFLRKFTYYPVSLLLRVKISIARSLLHGKEAWHALDALAVPGFGTDLVRIDFPPDASAKPRWGYGRPTHQALADIIDASQSTQLEFLRECLGHSSDCLVWPENEDLSRPEMPWRNNLFLHEFDRVALYGALRHLKPARYLEIGSGMSTRVAWQARKAGEFRMEIISVDPSPRLAISALCDHVHRQRLEDVTEEFLALVTPRTVVFFDGSHRSFPASDVTIFFLEILPRLPIGTVVHVHDIFLPDDYPAHAFNRLWSEQYLLAAWLLGGGRGIKVLLPCARLEHVPAARPLLEDAFGTRMTGGSSFWFETT